jgi:hypothetical protein
MTNSQYIQAMRGFNLSPTDVAEILHQEYLAQGDNVEHVTRVFARALFPTSSVQREAFFAYVCDTP